MNTRMYRTAAAAGLVLIFLAAGPAWAVENCWTGGAGNWDQDARWSLGTCPTGDQDALISGGPVSFNRSGQSVGALYLGQTESATLVLSGGDLTSIMAITVGNQRDATLNLNEGTLCSRYSTFYVGANGSGTINQSGGWLRADWCLWIGGHQNGLSTATGNVCLQGGKITVIAQLVLGPWEGRGTLTQTGGTVEISSISGADMYLGQSSTADNRYCISGGTLDWTGWNPDQGRVYVGAGGRGTFQMIGTAPVVRCRQYLQNVNGTLRVTLADDGISRIHVLSSGASGGRATLGGTLAVDIKGGMILTGTDQFDLLQAENSLVGDFATKPDPALWTTTVDTVARKLSLHLANGFGQGTLATSSDEVIGKSIAPADKGWFEITGVMSGDPMEVYLAVDPGPGKTSDNLTDYLVRSGLSATAISYSPYNLKLTFNPGSTTHAYFVWDLAAFDPGARISAVGVRSVYSVPVPGCWRVLPLAGQSEFIFSMYGMPTGLTAFQGYVAALTNQHVANGFDPLNAPSSSLVPEYQYVASLGWPATVYNANAPLTPEQESALAVLDRPGAVAPVQFYEWDYAFHEGGGGTIKGYDHLPANKQEAYNLLKAHYLQHAQGMNGRLTSVTGHSHYEAYAAEWGTRTIGLEVGENVRYTQTKLAFARGAARQWGLPWSVQVSPWMAGSCTTSGPLRTENGLTLGLDAGHSFSFYQRLWRHAWFAGAAMVTPENSVNGFFETSWTLNSLGQLAAQVLPFAQAHDRGVPFTPLVIVLDHYAGYNGYEGKPWGVLTNTEGDQQIKDLFDWQLVPGADDWTQMNAAETAQLRATPFGETFDIVLSTIPANKLRSYPEILLAGDLNFEESFVSQLEAALRAGSRLLLLPRHATALGDNLARLQMAGRVEILAESLVPGTMRPAAISNERLGQIVTEHLPVMIQGDPVAWQVNRTDSGWIVEIINHNGVHKAGHLPAVIDPNAVAHVQLSSNVPVRLAREWILGDNLSTVLSSWDLTIPPGETRFVEIETASVGALTGTIVLQGLAGTVTAVPITVEFRQSGMVVRTDNVTLDGLGRFTIANIAVGTYDVQVKAPSRLTRAVAEVAIAGATDIGVLTLVGGDANGDNAVTFEDFSILQNHYGQSGLTGREGDFNGDGQVTFEDFSILQNSYGQIGTPAAPAAPMAAADGCGTQGMALCMILGLALMTLKNHEYAWPCRVTIEGHGPALHQIRARQLL